MSASAWSRRALAFGSSSLLGARLLACTLYLARVVVCAMRGAPQCSPCSNRTQQPQRAYLHCIHARRLWRASAPAQLSWLRQLRPAFEGPAVQNALWRLLLIPHASPMHPPQTPHASPTVPRIPHKSPTHSPSSHASPTNPHASPTVPRTPHKSPKHPPQIPHASPTPPRIPHTRCWRAHAPPPHTPPA